MIRMPRSMIPVPASLIFIGHFGIVLAAKKILPKVCLDTLARVSVHYRATRQDRPVWILVIHIFLVIAWVGSLAAGAPPNTTALAWGGLSIWITVLWD